MDPETTLAEFLDAVGHRDWDRVEECSENLLTWISKILLQL